MQVSPEEGGEILCDTGWCVHKPDVQNKWDDNEDQCEWHRMTMMTEPDCAVISSLINTHTHTVCTWILVSYFIHVPVFPALSQVLL